LINDHSSMCPRPPPRHLPASTASKLPQPPKPPSLQSPCRSHKRTFTNARHREATVPVSLAGVPFLTGQKGNGKSRPAGRAAADGSDPCRGHESASRFAIRPSTGQSRPRRRTAKGRGDGSSGNEGEPQGDTRVESRIPIPPFVKFPPYDEGSRPTGKRTVLLLHLTVFSKRP
jgi:hypothetical protein